jgi:hypothetical protein
VKACSSAARELSLSSCPEAAFITTWIVLFGGRVRGVLDGIGL